MTNYSRARHFTQYILVFKSKIRRNYRLHFSFLGTFLWREIVLRGRSRPSTCVVHHFDCPVAWEIALIAHLRGRLFQAVPSDFPVGEEDRIRGFTKRRTSLGGMTVAFVAPGYYSAFLLKHRRTARKDRPHSHYFLFLRIRYVKNNT